MTNATMTTVASADIWMDSERPQNMTMRVPEAEGDIVAGRGTQRQTSKKGRSRSQPVKTVVKFGWTARAHNA